MKKIIQSLIVTAVILGSTGCATSIRAITLYRIHDAADIVTLTGGTGIGAKVKAGPVATGIFLNRDVIGMRGSETFYRNNYDFLDIWTPIPVVYGDLGWLCGIEEWNADDPDPRRKSFSHRSEHPLVISDLFDDSEIGCWETPYPYQIEVGAGLGLSVHAGINLAELADFILGFIGIDIFNDDI